MTRSRRLAGFLYCAFLILLFPVSSFGAKLVLSSPAGGSGEWVTVEIGYQSSPGQELVALQWEAEIPSVQLDLRTSPITRLLLVAKEAGKSLDCSLTPKTPEIQLLRCILAGGGKPIPDATIAVLSFQIGERSPQGTAHIRFEKVIGVGRDLKPTDLSPAEAVVTIRGH